MYAFLLDVLKSENDVFKHHIFFIFLEEQIRFNKT